MVFPLVTKLVDNGSVSYRDANVRGQRREEEDAEPGATTTKLFLLLFATGILQTNSMDHAPTVMLSIDDMKEKL